MNTQIIIHYGIYTHIEPYWDGTTYYGTCWRFLYNHTPGARVVTRHETIDMSPSHIYLMPPGVTFTATQKNNPKQFGLHFHATPPYDRVQAKVYAISIDPLLADLLHKTLQEIRPHPAFLSDAGNLYAVSLVAATLARIPSKNVTVKAVDLRVEEAMQMFRDRIHESIGLEEAARKIGLSKGAFIRLFKKETGTTPYAWLLEARIRWACDLLVRDSAPIDLIAQYTGFNDRFHFSKTFKQHIGLSPAAYRRRESIAPSAGAE